MIRMYDFGADTSNVCSNERKALAWPIAVWSCYIPESECQDLNILEHLILRLVASGVKEPQSVLCRNIGFNKDLVEAAIEICKDKEYFDRRYSELTLSSDGKSVLGTFENPYSNDLEISRKCKRIYMVQDLVTKSVVPIFNIEKLPQFYIEEEDVIEIRYDKSNQHKPKGISIKAAMTYWQKLCHNQRLGLASGTNTVDFSDTSDSAETAISEFVPFEDEVDWTDIATDQTNKIDDIRTLADREDEEKLQAQETSIRNLTILDDTPEIYFARGYVAINKNAPDEAIVISPFGSNMDNWFRTVMNRLRTCDEAFKEEIQLFLMLKRDELKDVIAFGNDLNINLFNEYPYICNDPDFKAVKTTISRLSVSKNRFENGEDDTITFAQTLRTAYEASIRLVVKNNPDLFKYRNLQYEEYRKNLKLLVDSYAFLDKSVLREYDNPNLYKNMVNSKETDGSTTGFFALLLMDAWENKTGKSMDLIRNMPELPIRLKKLTSNLKGEKGMGNAASHGGDEIAELKITKQKAFEQYEEFENIFRALYNRFMEGR